MNKMSLSVLTQRRLSSGDAGPEICHKNAINDSTGNKFFFLCYKKKGHRD
jgi:hypothetical protein